MFARQMRSAIIMLGLFTLLTGLMYPFAVTGIAQLIFPWRANGSLIMEKRKVRGSELIGQPFSSPRYFWGRLSATGPFAYNAGASSGSNYGPLNPALLKAATDRVAQLRSADPSNDEPIPVDLVTASGSGLDPHISIAAALYQVPRVARARNIQDVALRALVERYTETRDLGVLGEPGVNVLQLNLALDAMSFAKGTR